MKLKNRLIIVLNNGYIVLLFIAIIVSLPLQCIAFTIKGKNRILNSLENRIYKTVFHNNDLRKKTYQSAPK